MKPFQYNKYVEEGEIHRTWQFGVFKGRSLLWVNYENPGFVYLRGGFQVTLSFFTDSLLGVELNNNKWSLSLYFMAKYFIGWED